MTEIPLPLILLIIIGFISVYILKQVSKPKKTNKKWVRPEPELLTKEWNHTFHLQAL